jgi:HAD superfamily hydrolase (TIGR01484 family)
MFFVALAVDYDGTLAREGRVDTATIGALEKIKKSGRKLILVTGRELTDLQRVFPEIEIFDLVVAENGALLFDPARKNEEPLAPAPSDRFVEALRARQVAPLSIGRCIVAIWEPYETVVLEAIRDLGLELHILARPSGTRRE